MPSLEGMWCNVPRIINHYWKSSKTKFHISYPFIKTFNGFPNWGSQVNIGEDLKITKVKQDIITLREKCRYSEFFWPIFSSIRTAYGQTRIIKRISPYPVWRRENTAQKNSEYGYFSRSAKCRKIVEMQSPIMMKSLGYLDGCLTSLAKSLTLTCLKVESKRPHPIIFCSVTLK